VVIGHGPGVGLELAAKAVSPGGHVSAWSRRRPCVTWPQRDVPRKSRPV
jgi:hypothetical protein